MSGQAWLDYAKTAQAATGHKCSRCCYCCAFDRPTTAQFYWKGGNARSLTRQQQESCRRCIGQAWRIERRTSMRPPNFSTRWAESGAPCTFPLERPCRWPSAPPASSGVSMVSGSRFTIMARLMMQSCWSGIRRQCSRNQTPHNNSPVVPRKARDVRITAWGEHPIL